MENIMGAAAREYKLQEPQAPGRGKAKIGAPAIDPAG